MTLMTNKKKQTYVAHPSAIVYLDCRRWRVYGAASKALTEVSDPLLPHVLHHFQRPRALDGSRPEVVGGLHARWDELVAQLASIGLLIPVRHHPLAAARRPSAPSGIDSELMLDVAVMSRFVQDIGTQLPALEAEDRGWIADESLRPRLALARELLETVARSFEELGHRKVTAYRRKLARARRRRPMRVNLASGPRNIRGWINVDVSCGDVRQCLQWGLPFADGTVEYVFFAHGLEHFHFKREALDVLRDIRRVLTPEGTARIVVPDIGKFMVAYSTGDERFFAVRRKHWRWERRCRTHLEQTLLYSGASSEPHAFLSHKWGYDFDTLECLLREAGFGRVERSEFMQSPHRALRIDDRSAAGSVMVDEREYSLFVEANP